MEKIHLPYKLHNKLLALRKSELRDDLSVGSYSNMEILERMVFDVRHHQMHVGNNYNTYSKSPVFREYAEEVGSQEEAERRIAYAVYNPRDYEVIPSTPQDKIEYLEAKLDKIKKLSKGYKDLSDDEEKTEQHDEFYMGRVQALREVIKDLNEVFAEENKK